jgi:crossover junction endodeoxyribonuclease RuvC
MDRAGCVLGLDVSLRCTGYGVVASEGSRLAARDCGVIPVAQGVPLTECLRRIHETVVGLLARWSPAAVAVEGGFFHRNARTAMILGQARGAAICACGAVPVYEYAPRKVKQAVVGYGAADKSQVAAMIVRMLSLPAEPPEDAADALSIAVCHLQTCAGHPALAPAPI